MRRTATVAVGTTIAIGVFGGGLAMAFDGGGSSARGPASVTLTAAPSSRPEDSASAPPSDSGGVGPSVPSGTVPATEISRSEAEQAALRTVPGGRIESVELEREHGRPVWDVDVLSGGVEHRIQVDARTGAVVRKKIEHGGEDHRGRDDARTTDDHGRHDRTRTSDDHGGRGRSRTTDDRSRHDQAGSRDNHGGRDRRDDRSEGGDDR